MDLLELVDQLEDSVLQGRQARFGGGWAVDRAVLLELIDRMRSAVPAEVEDARKVMRERNEVLAKAEEEAHVILTKARQEAENLVNSHDLVLDAQRQNLAVFIERERGLGEAVAGAVEQALEADRYSLDMLQRLDAQLAAIQTSVRAGVDQLGTKVSRGEEQAAVEQRDRSIREEYQR